MKLVHSIFTVNYETYPHPMTATRIDSELNKVCCKTKVCAYTNRDEVIG